MGQASAEKFGGGEGTRRRRAGWPSGLVGMLVLVGAGEWFVKRHDSAFTTLNAAAWRRSGERVGEAQGAEVVGLGDSLVKHGFAPPVLESRYGLKGANLAVPGGRFPAHFVLLRRLIEAGARPKAVLVDGEMMGEDPLGVGRVWSELATVRESVELGIEGGDWGFSGRMVMAKGLGSVRGRPEIRGAILAALAGTPLEEPRALPIYLRNWKRNGGAQLLAEPDLSKGDARPAELEKADYRPVAWACNEVNARYAERLIELAAKHGVRVYWLLPPYHPEVQVRREKYGWYAQYVKYLEGMLAKHGNLTIVDGRHAGYPAGVLADMTHLSRTGAVTYTDALGDVIASERAATERWVVLPRFDGERATAMAAASGLEDVPGSGKALARVMEGVREAKARGEDGRRRR